MLASSSAENEIQKEPFDFNCVLPFDFDPVTLLRFYSYHVFHMAPKYKRAASAGGSGSANGLRKAPLV
jgi:hypothetical protein